MAKNPNTSLYNVNTLYLACSGGGKSQALKQNKTIPRQGVRVLLWDIDHDHAANRFENMPEYIRAVKSAIKSGSGFRLAYSGDDNPEMFEQWCRVVWAVLDGRKKTYILIEELADVVKTAGKAGENFGRLLRKCRKFNGRLHVTSQRGAEIPKTAYTQCQIKFIGQQEGADIDKMARIAGVIPVRIQELKPLEFYKKIAGTSKAVKIKHNYIK